MLIDDYEVISLYPCILHILNYNLEPKYTFPKSNNPLYHHYNCKTLDSTNTIFYDDVKLESFNYIPEKKENTLYIVNESACYSLKKLGFDYFIFPQRHHKLENRELYYFNLFKP